MTLLRILPILLSFAPAFAQAPHRPTAPLPDRAWLKANAGNTNAITSDLRYQRLLTAAFPQHQWFWYEHNRFLTVPQLTETFLGIPGDHTAVLTSGRYLTITGCVPHDCTDNGLLWIDTEPDQPGQTTRLLFAANPLVSGGSRTHLWPFTSSNRFDWQKPDSDFLSQLKRWLASLTTGLPAPDDRQHVTLVTIVSPDGRQNDRPLEDLLPHQTGAPK